MFGKTNEFRSIGMTVAALLWGCAPLAAQGVGPAPNDVFIAPPPAGAGCGAGIPWQASVTIAAEPRADIMKDAPFSGVGTSEVVTTLSDGNRIVRTNRMKYYRDRSGRTRTEYSLGAIGPFTPDQAQTAATITDPIESRRYVLHPALKRAEIFQLLDGLAGTFTRSGNGNGAFWTGTFSSSGPATAPAAGLNTGTARMGTTAVQPRVRAPSRDGELIPFGGPTAVAPPIIVSSTAAGLAPANAGFIMQYSQSLTVVDNGGCKQSAKPLPSPISMGERIIEGLKVTGTKQEFTIAAGAVGNEQPIVVRSEQWFSPELGVVVSSTHRDPMMGDTSYKLEQVSRAEPDPALFTVPADYTQEEVSPYVYFNSAAPPPPGAPTPGAAGSTGTYRMRTAPPPKPAQ